MRSIVTDISKLNTRCDEVNYDFRKGEIIQTIKDIKKVLYANENLVCLAAPQVGVNVRLFCIKFNDGDIRTFINPIVIRETGTHLSRECCASLPDKEYIIPRSDEIDVAYQTPTGASEVNTFKGYPAEVFQQMVNLLDGVLISDFGLEVLEDWDKATEEERQEVIKMYLESLNNVSNTLEEEIKSNDDLMKLDKAVKFSYGLAKGEVTIEKLNKDEIENIVNSYKNSKEDK